MNKIYQSVWNETTGAWVATSETARAKGKRSASCKLMLAQAVLAGSVLISGGAAHAFQNANAQYYFDANSPADPALDAPARAIAPETIAIGVGATATAANAVSIGSGTTASGVNSLVAGAAASVSQDYGVALGYNSAANGTAATALGMMSKANGASSLALGTRSTAQGVRSVSIGENAIASTDNSVALGEGASATNANSVALGATSTTTANLSAAAAAFGTNATKIAGATAAGEVSVGSAGNERRITNLAAGSAPTDAVNVSQLGAVNGKVDTLAAAAVQYDTDASGNVNKNSVTLGGTTSNDGGVTGGTTMTNLHQGAVSATSTDAVNGAQLFAVTGDTSSTYVTQNGTGIKYVRTNDTGLTPDDAHASGIGASALGYNAQAAGAGSVAIGMQSQASADGSVALGQGSVADRTNTVSVGSAGAERQITNVAAGTNGTDAVNLSQLTGAMQGAVNYDKNADGSVNTSSVTLAGATSNDGGVTGGTTVTNLHQGAVSATSTDAVNGAQLFAVTGDTSSTYVTQNGTGIKYVRTNDTGLTPDDAHASGVGASALGYNAQAAGAGSVAIGMQSQASADGSVALGQGSVADRANTVSVGSAGAERQITNVAAGTNGTDAVNVSQLTAAMGSAVQYDKNADGSPNYNSVTLQGTPSTDGGKTGGTKITNVAQGDVSADSTDAVNGAQLYASQQAATRYFKADGANDGTDDAQVASGTFGVASGADANASGDNSVALGHSASASADGSVALGAGSLASASNSVALGAGSIADRANSVSVGSAGNERQITNVAAGTADTDAVNVAQLNAVASQAAKVDGAVMYDTNPDGTTNNNSVTLSGTGGTLIHNVADGIDATDAVNLGQMEAAISGAINNIAPVASGSPFFSADGDTSTEAAQATGTHSTASGANALASGTNAVAMGANSVASGNNATAIGANATASADNSVALGQGSVADRANSVSVGAAGSERQITNVAAGTAGTDAVNVDQLNSSMGNAVSQANSYTDDKIRSARRDAYGGTAAAMAVAGLPQAVLPGHGMVALGAGTYGGQSAIALGISQLSDTGKWAYKVQATSDTRGQFGASVGAGMHW